MGRKCTGGAGQVGFAEEQQASRAALQMAVAVIIIVTESHSFCGAGVQAQLSWVPAARGQQVREAHESVVRLR